MITNNQLHILHELLSSLKTRCIGLDDFERLVEEKRKCKKKLEENKEFVNELFTQHSVKLDDHDPRLFDSAVSKEEDVIAVNAKLKDFDKKEVQFRSFLDKKKLQQLMHENSLTIGDYELLTDAFYVETKTKEKEPKNKK